MTTPGPFVSRRAAGQPAAPTAPAAPIVDPALEPLLDAAGRARQKLQRSVAAVERATTGAHRQAAASGARRVMVTEYLPAVNRLRQAAPAAQRQDALEALTARLERGWALGEAGALDAEGDTLFVALLAQYEALGDSLTDDVLTPFLRRLELREAGR